MLAAHGSPSNTKPAEAARAVAAAIEASGAFREVCTGFVDEPPYLADVARGVEPGVCLPFFAAENGHVREDLPEALAEAGFTGPLLPAIGTDARDARDHRGGVPALGAGGGGGLRVGLPRADTQI